MWASLQLADDVNSLWSSFLFAVADIIIFKPSCINVKNNL